MRYLGRIWNSCIMRTLKANLDNPSLQMLLLQNSHPFLAVTEGNELECSKVIKRRQKIRRTLGIRHQDEISLLDFYLPREVNGIPTAHQFCVAPTIKHTLFETPRYCLFRAQRTSEFVSCSTLSRSPYAASGARCYSWSEHYSMSHSSIECRWHEVKYIHCAWW